MPRTVAEVDGFITLLRVACEDPSINARLEQILALPDERRQALLHTLVSDMLIAKAPKDFVEAIACLMDDAVAEKAYEVIFRCARE
jgi:hypothetical protein